MATKNALLTVHVCIPADRAADRPYLEELEDAVVALAGRWREVKRGSSSVDSDTSEAFGLVVGRGALVEDVAEEVIAAIRKVGTRRAYKIHLTKREDGCTALYVRAVYPRRDSKWILQTQGESRAAPLPNTDFPQRIQDLADWINRFYLAGGPDADEVFENDGDLSAFLDSLSDADASGLRDVYQRIVRRRDHTFLMDWITEDDDDRLSAKDRAGYFLALLDRLCQGGLFAGRKQKCVGLVDWNRVV